MAMAQATAKKVQHEDFVKYGNWTEERRAILENLSEEEIDAEVLQLQAEHPERLTIVP